MYHDMEGEARDSSDRSDTPDPLDNIRRAELKRILRHRGVSEVEVHNAVEDILTEQRRWTATALGLRMELPFTEWERLGIRTMRCIDRSHEMMRLYVAERKLERDRIRKGKKRAMNVKTKGLSPRAQELAAVLNSDWQQSCDLVELIENRLIKNCGRRLKHDAIRKSVLRASRELCDIGIAEQKVEVGPRGGYVRHLKWSESTTFRQSDFGEGTVFCTADKVQRTKSRPLTEEVQQAQA